MNKKKKIVLIITVICLIISIIGIITMTIDENKEEKFVSSFVYNTELEHGSYIFHKPIEGNITDDPDYNKVVPYIYYTNNNVTVCITDEDYEKYGPAVVLFGKYFDALKSGDTETFLSLFSDRYFENNYKWENIYPQRIYDIKVEYLFEKDLVDELYGNVTKYVFKTKYMIMKNDGSFRNDIDSDSCRPLYLEIVYDDGEYFIDAVGTDYNLPQ